jgi:hypothetical protein
MLKEIVLKLHHDPPWAGWALSLLRVLLHGMPSFEN